MKDANQSLFDFLFGSESQQTKEPSEAASRARVRFEQNRIDATLSEVSRLEKMFGENPCAATAYELGDGYDHLIDVFGGQKHLSRRKEVKRKLLGLLLWMEREGIDLGEAREVLELLQIELSCMG